jgi:hypothetical protein
MAVTPEQTSFLKQHLLDLIAGGDMPSDAARALRIDWRTLARWKREDAIFAQDYRDSVDALADALAAKAVDAHLLASDAKNAQVAQRGWQWAAERLAPDRYGQRVKIDDKTGGAQLLQLLQEAIRRIAPAVGETAVDITPKSRIDTKALPQETHRP